MSLWNESSTEAASGSDDGAVPRSQVMGCCEMEAPFEPSEDCGIPIDPSRDLYPRCIVWTWLPGCTCCSLGIVGHLGIASSSGEIWELVGLGASRNQGKLAFGPVVRYLPLSPKLVGKGTFDQGLAAAIKKMEGHACHPLNNCHCFVANCLQEMRYLGFPYWSCFWWILAVWVWICGRFATPVTSMACVIPTLLLTCFLYLFWTGVIS
eukprot:gnl/TRDRNA2_/TRDRNA2_40628_c0_seq1.p1 gnl/TRDRNA2_/TRDRNA2_40628_c0~~gnl/TRDRNA2_/TRDRNA2_40628_c0_seq1.p1  ORF type:complete len:208 (-),score=30.19 gnl/TRDRNA2_/TRDRNA2_40628_c0_seq1:50-673(-)